MDFPTILENKFVGSADGNILSWCPTMELITITMNRMSLWVYRLNGERVYSVNNRSPITDIAWKPDGQSFSLIGIDGVCKIYDSNSGRLVHVIEPGRLPGQPILNITQTINWCLQKTTVPSTIGNPLFSGLFDLDLSTCLPVLPHSTSIDSQFTYTSKVMVDDISSSISLHESDYLIVVDSRKNISITFHSLFTVNSIVPPLGIDRFLQHTSTFSEMSKQFFLINHQQEFSLLQMNLNIDSYGSYMVEITSQCSKVLAILGYLEENFEILSKDTKPFIDLFDRNLTNFKDCLYEGVDLTVHFPTEKESEDKMSASLYDILLTNLIPESQRDFWLNQLGERGLKRLTTLSVTAFDMVRRTSFCSIVAALERLITILSRLEGLSKWLDSEAAGQNEGSNGIGLSSEALSIAISLSGKLLQVVYKFIWEMNEEQKLFNSFLEWLRSTIVERLIKEDDILNNVSLNEKLLQPNTYKINDIMKYINEYLFRSRLLKYVKIDSNPEVITLPDSPTYLIDEFQGLKQSLNDNLLHQVRTMIKSNVTFESCIPLSLDATQKQHRIQISSNDIDGYIVSINESNSILSLIRFRVANPQEFATIHIDFSTECTIQKCEIINAEEIIMLSSASGIRTIDSLRITELDFTQNGIHIPYKELNSQKSRSFSHDGSKEDQFNPAYVATGGSISKIFGCLLDENKQNFLIFSSESK
ncbi:hypothetical protein CAAN1_02S04830 [[Candida] anglica]|uniref:Anaphase-promoting complex subunit 4 n=1 Tax=[Candida] anglica TaxID=148631 RepID=A0ABP0ECC2_9ASCO